jgi:outer membrane PBP1 activator LpoA protein
LLEYRSYQVGSQDFSVEIEGLMHLSDSVQRYRRLRANIDQPLQFESRRRQDAEFIFLATDANVGRLIKPQLRFHYSGDLPVYSTSSIYAMDGRSNTDLNGVMFADVPWIIEPGNQFSGLPTLYRESWPEKQQLARLQAMGYDAYQLAPALFSNLVGPIPDISGGTGQLRLDSSGRVHRRLSWAQFKRGQPVALPSLRDLAVTPPAPAETDDSEWQDETAEE